MSDVRKGVVIPLDVAELIVKVFLPVNERRMRNAHPDVVAAVTEFKRCVNARHVDDSRHADDARTRAAARKG